MQVNVAKQAAAVRAVSYIQNGMIVGLGTGSTAYYAMEEIAKRLQQGLSIKGVPTSLATQALAEKFHIPLLEDFTKVDVTIDGADEVDENGNLLKGGGGALTREKIVASASQQEIIIIDPSKKVRHLGKFPLPVEVIPFGWQVAARRLEKLGCTIKLRKKGSGVFRTDNGHCIVDCEFNEITQPEKLSAQINMIPGVVENGLFVGLTDLVVIGHSDGQIDELKFGK